MPRTKLASPEEDKNMNEPEQNPEESKKYRPTSLNGFDITYGRVGAGMEEATLTRNGKRYGSIRGEFNERNLQEQADRATTRYQDEQRRIREQANK